MSGNREDGDDLYQDALVCALTRFDDLRQLESFRPWLYRIIVNFFKNRIKRPWWKRVMPLSSEIAEITVGENPGPVLAARRRLELAMSTLSPDDRALVTLFELEGWTIKEIAKITGKTAGSLRVRLTRARSKMRSALMRYFRQSGSAKDINRLHIEDKVCVVQKPVKD
jgi:RNA polymerase sigma-70 factor (ECF subfamily)